MDYTEHNKLNKALLIIIAITIGGGSLIVIISLSIINSWNAFQILLAIGVPFLVLGGFGIIAAYNAGTRASSSYTHTISFELAQAEINYSRKRRLTFPALSILFLIIGIIFMSIGIAKIWE